MGSEIERVAVVGAGVIGSGWAARFLGAGLDVDAWDPAPDARSKAFAAIDAAWPAMARRGMAAGASPSRLTFHERLEDCVAERRFRSGKRAGARRTQAGAARPHRRRQS